MVLRRILATAAIVAFAGWAGTGAAIAAPANARNAQPLSLSCDNGQTYSAVTNSGNSNANTFSPAHDLNSTSVLVPTSFGEFTFTLTNASGQIVQEFTQPASSKGNAQARGYTPVHCTFTFSQTFTVTQAGGDLPPGTYTFTGTGSAIGFIPSQK